MKLGILNAIDPAKSGVNWNKTPFDGYVRFLDEIDCGFEYVHYVVALGNFPAAPDECDAYIITGSPDGAYEQLAWIDTLSQFIRDCYAADIKLIGICFGHQILAQALGGRVEKSEKGRGFGEKSFSISHKKEWMGDFTPDECKLYFAHQDQVMMLPPHAELLGGNDFCPIALYTVEDKVLGMQGHPEFTPSIMEDIQVMLEGNMDEGMYKTAVSSLQNANPDRKIAGRWIHNFLRG